MKDASASNERDRTTTTSRNAKGGIRRRLAIGFGSQAVAVLLRVTQQLLVVPILIWGWGVNLYADWIIIFAATSFLTMLDLGLQTYFGNALLIAVSRREFARYHRLMATGLFLYLSIVVIAVVALAGVSAAVSWPTLFATRVMSTQVAISTAAILVASRLLDLPMGLVATVYRAHGDYTRGAVVHIIAEALRGFGICAVVFLGGTPIAAALVYLSITILFGITIFVDKSAYYGEGLTGLATPTRAEIRQAIMRSAFYFLSTVTVPVVVNAPILLLGYLSNSPGAVIAYTVSRTLTGFMRQITSQFCHPIGIELAYKSAAGDQAGQQRVFSAAGRMVAGFSGLLGGFTLVAAHPFLEIWTHGKVEFDPWVIGAFIAAIILTAPAQVAGTLYMYNNKPTALAFAQMTNAVGAIGLCFALIGRFGVAGAAMATGGAEFVSVGLILPYFAAKDLLFSPIRYLIRAYTAASGAFILSYAIAWVGNAALAVSGLIQLSELAMFWVSAITLPSFFLLLNTQERAWLLSKFSKRLMIIRPSSK